MHLHPSAAAAVQKGRQQRRLVTEAETSSSLRQAKRKSRVCRSSRRIADSAGIDARLTESRTERPLFRRLTSFSDDVRTEVPLFPAIRWKIGIFPTISGSSVRIVLRAARFLQNKGRSVRFAHAGKGPGPRPQAASPREARNVGPSASALRANPAASPCTSSTERPYPREARPPHRATTVQSSCDYRATLVRLLRATLCDLDAPHRAIITRLSCNDRRHIARYTVHGPNALPRESPTAIWPRALPFRMQGSSAAPLWSGNERSRNH